MNFNNLNSSELQNFVFLVLLLTFLTISLIARKDIKIGKTIKYLGTWLVIALISISIYSYRHQFYDFKDRILGEINPSHARTRNTGTIVINMSQNNHFYMKLRINGKDIKFMIDTGASDVVLNKQDAKLIGINFKKLIFNKRYQTANGISWGANILLERIKVGNVEFNDVQASVNKSNMGTSLLGMSFLRKFKKYEFYQDRLILTLF